MDHTHHHVPEAQADEPLKDPVCGMAVTSSSPHHHAYHGQHFYFCNPKCLDKFRADPARYLSPAPALAETLQPVVEDAEYTCPMHPEVRQAQPGSCPKCGMQLKPKSETAHKH